MIGVRWRGGLVLGILGTAMLASVAEAQTPSRTWAIIVADQSKAFDDKALEGSARTSVEERGGRLVPQADVAAALQLAKVTPAKLTVEAANELAAVLKANALLVIEAQACSAAGKTVLAQACAAKGDIAYRLRRFALGNNTASFGGAAPASDALFAIEAGVMALVSAKLVTPQPTPAPVAAPAPASAGAGAKAPVAAAAKTPSGKTNGKQAAAPAAAPAAPVEMPLEPVPPPPPKVEPPPPPPVVYVAPGPPDAILFAHARSLSFGVTPGVAGSASDLGSTSTGVSNVEGGMQGGFAGFVGGTYTNTQLTGERTLQIEARWRTTLASRVDSATTPDQTESGYGLALNVDRLFVEYLHYLDMGVGLPTFVGTWSTVGITYTVDKPALPDAESTTGTVLPLRLSVGAGAGRVYPIHWRVVLERWEATLLRDGNLTEPIPDSIATTILARWYADRDQFELPFDRTKPYGWSYHRQMLGALQILKDAGLLKKPVHLLTAYRLQRLLLDENNIDRWQGWDARAGLRIAKRYDREETGSLETDADTDVGLAVEVLARRYYNLSLESDLRIEPSAAIAPRDKDEAVNDLAGTRRVALGGEPTDLTTDVFLPTGRVVIDVPVTYARFIYDGAFDLIGYWNIHVGATAGLAADDPAFAGSAGFSYTFFTKANTGYTIGVNGGAGIRGGDLEYQFNFVAALGFGSGGEYYTAPDQVGDSVPFDTGWLPGGPARIVPAGPPQFSPAPDAAPAAPPAPATGGAP
jgi:hypothetical protein